MHCKHVAQHQHSRHTIVARVCSMISTRAGALALLIGAALGAFGMTAAHAQGSANPALPYPSRALHLVNVYPPGGASDVVARYIAQKLSDGLGQPVIVDNRAGAGGAIGNDYVAKQAPDGYTILLVTGAYPVQAAMVKTLPFDPLRDIAMVSMLTQYPFVINVLPSASYRTLPEFIAFARSNPGKLNYSSAGIGSVHHLSGELFNALAGTDIGHIPFRGGAAPMTELLAGRVDVLFEAMTLSLPYIQAGKLRALAVTSRERSPALPDTPVAEQTLPGYVVTSFLGIGTTAGTPAAVIERLNREIRTILATPEAARRFVELGGEPQASSPAQMHDLVAAEITKWRKVIETRRIERQ
jgi:tripartite-type tricarboxylate transporter receptor subunit TctC